MCGIAGFSGHFNIELLQAMNARIAHRGPDDEGVKILTDDYNTVGLAHRRLSIIDLSAVGQQPMTLHCQHCQTGNNKIWLTYNGEIYNFGELRQKLIEKGHQFFSHTDSEVLLHLYHEYGVKMLEHLNGIYAFAIFDGRAKPGELFIARDGLGVKPLYYTQNSDGFLFASELKALLVSQSVERKLDLTALHYYLAYLWAPGECTALQAVKKLQPGEALTVTNGRIKKRWFHYDVPYTGVYSQQTSKELVAELDQRLQTAVRRQVMADVPVGAFLSGGLDSSAIVSYMRRQNPDTTINCYSIGFKDGMQSEGNPDDLPYARAVAKHLGVTIHPMELEADIINNLQHMIYHLDEPQADPAPLHVYTIAQAARADGIKVLLSGAGGDDIFSGYRRHQAVAFSRVWQFMPKKTRHSVSRFANRMLEGETSQFNLQNPLTRRIAKLLAPINLESDRQLAHHFLWGTESLRRGLYSPQMAAEVANIDTLHPLLNSLQRIPKETNLLNRTLYLETKHFLADHNLNYTDKMAMAAGVEVRVPLLDPELVAFAASIPARHKLHANISKAIFKKTMESYLPKNIIYRKKAGFGAPLRRWLNNELRPLVDDILSTDAIKQRGIFDAVAVQNLIKANRENKVDASYTVFSLLCVEMWCRTFI